MTATIEHVLYSPTLGTLDLTGLSADGSCQFYLYGAQFGLATPATTTADALIGQSMTSSGDGNREASFYLGIKSLTANDGAGMANASAEVEQWRRANDAEYRYKPQNGARNCLPIITDTTTRRGGLKIEPTTAPVAGVDVVTDEWNQSWRWFQITLACHPFVLAESATIETIALSGGVGTVDVTGGGDAAATLSLAASSLGKCMAWVGPSQPSGFTPFIRANMASGGATTSPGVPYFYSATWRALSGATFNLDGTKYRGGGYTVVAHLYSATAQSVSIPITVTANGVTTTAVSGPVDLPAGESWLGGIAGLVLPETTGTITLTVGSLSGVYVDMPAIFPMAATPWLIDAGSDTEAFIAAPATANEDGSMSPVVSIGGSPQQGPILTDTTATVAAISTGTDLTCTLAYRAAFLTFATGEDPT